jgi:hypothetical protein
MMIQERHLDASNRHNGPMRLVNVPTGLSKNMGKRESRTSKQVAVVTFLVALGAAACGSSGPAVVEPLHVVQSAYITTLKAKTANVTFTESIKSASASGSNETSTVTGSGLVDLSNQGFELHVNAPSGGSEVVLETGGVEYVQVPPASQSQVPGNKPWVSVDLNQVAEAKLGKSFSQLASANSDNPTQVLANLAVVSDNVTNVGAATIDGTATTQYRATVDLTKEAVKVTAKDGAKAGQLITQEAQSLGTHTLPVEVWVDSNGLARQVEEEVPIPAASTGATNGSGSATLTMTFSNFGTPAILTPPPSSQVADITSQAVQQANASNG